MPSGFSRLVELQDHIRATDHHAPARLALLDVVVPVLDGRREASEAERADLAGKLERWRYQLLNERLAARSPVAGAFSAEDASPATAVAAVGGPESGLLA